MSKKTDVLGDRMKKNYEGISRYFLTGRVPVVIRLDGKAFHSFTKGFNAPFDHVFRRAMKQTMKYLCENIQGCVFGYTQSDEITLVLTDYAKTTTDAWFGYNVQKMASVAASMATLAFNREFQSEVNLFLNTFAENIEMCMSERTLYERYEKAVMRGALFDARVFSVPKDEVCNCLIWRQQDAVRNSIESVGQAYFSSSELDQKSTRMIKEMLLSERQIDWNDYPTEYKCGACCYRVLKTDTIQVPNRGEVTVERHKWYIDSEIPTFTQNREFVERWL